jgi:hypothetical protein
MTRYDDFPMLVETWIHKMMNKETIALLVIYKETETIGNCAKPCTVCKKKTQAWRALCRSKGRASTKQKDAQTKRCWPFREEREIWVPRWSFRDSDIPFLRKRHVRLGLRPTVDAAETFRMVVGLQCQSGASLMLHESVS